LLECSQSACGFAESSSTKKAGRAESLSKASHTNSSSLSRGKTTIENTKTCKVKIKGEDPFKDQDEHRRRVIVEKSRAQSPQTHRTVDDFSISAFSHFSEGALWLPWGMTCVDSEDAESVYRLNEHDSQPSQATSYTSEMSVATQSEASGENAVDTVENVCDEMREMPDGYYATEDGQNLVHLNEVTWNDTESVKSNSKTGSDSSSVDEIQNEEKEDEEIRSELPEMTEEIPNAEPGSSRSEDDESELEQIQESVQVGQEERQVETVETQEANVQLDEGDIPQLSNAPASHEEEISPTEIRAAYTPESYIDVEEDSIVYKPPKELEEWAALEERISQVLNRSRAQNSEFADDDEAMANSV
jgi:hypothetical protein